jgi:hypothetical protein
MPYLDSNCKTVGRTIAEHLPIGNFIEAIFSDEVLNCHWCYGYDHYFAADVKNADLRMWLCEAVEDAILKILSADFVTI